MKMMHIECDWRKTFQDYIRFSYKNDMNNLLIQQRSCSRAEEQLIMYNKVKKMEHRNDLTFVYQ